MEFNLASRVNIGKRHTSQADAAHFAGRVDDARIYSQALSGDQLAMLQPNVASALQPWAWWTFNEPQPLDHTGRFPLAELTGGATIADGTLVLDGTSGNFRCATGKEPPFTCETPARPHPVPTEWLTYHRGRCAGTVAQTLAAGAPHPARSGWLQNRQLGSGCVARGRHLLCHKILRLGEIAVPFALNAGEAADLRIFLDKNMIEVFANDRQAAVASHRYAPGNLGIQLISRGTGTTVSEVTAWRMRSAYP